MEKTNHIVALSGGKDSTAMAIRLRELNPEQEYIYMCTPTGDELPEMFAHWDNLERILGQKLVRLVDPEYPTIYDLIDHFQMLPNWRARWCTRVLKIEVAQKFYQDHLPAKIYVGLRADEPTRAGAKLFDENIEQVFPMQEWEWDIFDVHTYLQEKGVKIPRRTDCAMCFYQRIGEWWNLWKDNPDHFQRLIKLEDKIGKTLLSPGKFTNWPHALKDLKTEFDKGRIPRGADLQLSLFTRSKMCRACSL